VILPVQELNRKPYASILCYPVPKWSVVDKRIAELKSLGITEIEFAGDSSAAGVPVLGKGHEGIVVIAHMDGERLALKVHRHDSIRGDLFHESRMLLLANGIEVGPKFVNVTKDFLLSQLIEGGIFAKWLEENKEREVYRRVLTDVLEQCWRLDEAGIDHGELSNAPRHIIMSKEGKPFIVDFESASTKRVVSNVTTVCQYLFMGNSIAKELITEVMGEIDRERIVEISREYKKERTRDNFEAFLRVIDQSSASL
jgi:putative serine/threonine protein kinase